MYAFMLSERTLDLAQALNNGLRPKLEPVESVNDITYFVYHTFDPAEILSHSDFHKKYNRKDLADISVFTRK